MSLTFKPPITTDPAIRLIVQGRSTEPIHQDANMAAFVLPLGTTEARLISRAQLPTLARPWLEDRRKLGIPVTRITLINSDDVRDVPVDHPGLTKGWWAVEREGKALRRWTDG